MDNSPPKGLIGALIIPLDNEGKIDTRSLENLINSTLNHVDGFLTGVTFPGEGFLLPDDKRLKIIRTTLEIVRGKVPIIVGITGNSLRETAENIKFLEKVREDSNYPGEVFLFDCPLWYHSNRGLPHHYRELAKLTGLPFVLYNNPYLIGRLKGHLRRRNIRTNVLKKLSGEERIVALEHSGTAKRILNYLRAVRERKDFVFYDGDEVNFLNSPGPGGVISMGANILPEDWKEIVASSLNPYDSRKENPDYCRRLWETGERLKLFHSVYRSNPAAIIKTALKHMGIIKSNRVVAGTDAITGEEEKRIHSLLIKYGLISK